MRYLPPFVMLSVASSLIWAPQYFPFGYALFILLYATYVTTMFFHQAVRLWRGCDAVIRQERVLVGMTSEADDNSVCLLRHLIVLPNYKEQLWTLRETLDFLASHRSAKDAFYIVLAMEGREDAAAEKASTLVNQYTHSFRKGEARGKSSNVNHAVREAKRLLVDAGLATLDSIAVTVADADAHIPERYFLELDRILSTSAQPHHVVACPPIFFSRNFDDVPAAVRITDIMWSMMVLQNLQSPLGVVFPCSTYSMSLALAHSVGYWDVGDEAIGEDMHMFLKCFFATGGNVCGVPIHVPIHLTNVQGASYLEGLKARYHQGLRHFMGVHDVCYTVSHCIAQWNSLSFGKMLLVLKTVCDAHLLPSTQFWVVNIAANCLGFVYPNFNTDPTLAALLNLTRVVLSFVVVAFAAIGIAYERMHQEAGKNKRTWRHLLDWLWAPVSLTLFCGLPSMYATLKLLSATGGFEYVVAQKPAAVKER